MGRGGQHRESTRTARLEPSSGWHPRDERVRPVQPAAPQGASTGRSQPPPGCRPAGKHAHGLGGTRLPAPPGGPGQGRGCRMRSRKRVPVAAGHALPHDPTSPVNLHSEPPRRPRPKPELPLPHQDSGLCRAGPFTAQASVPAGSRPGTKGAGLWDAGPAGEGQGCQGRSLPRPASRRGQGHPSLLPCWGPPTRGRRSVELSPNLTDRTTADARPWRRLADPGRPRPQDLSSASA